VEFSYGLWVYHKEDKMDFLIELSSFCSRNREPIMIGGNFNIVRYSNERNKPGAIIDILILSTP
jgi:hypothetical protein